MTHDAASDNDSGAELRDDVRPLSVASLGEMRSEVGLTHHVGPVRWAISAAIRPFDWGRHVR